MCCLLIRFYTYCALFCTIFLSSALLTTEQAEKGILIILNASLWRYVLKWRYSPRWRFFKTFFLLELSQILTDCWQQKFFPCNRIAVMCCLLIRYYTYCILNFFVPFVVSSALRNKLKKVSWQFFIQFFFLSRCTIIYLQFFK